MADVDAIFSRSVTPSSGYRDWRSGGARFVDRFRKSVVAASLITGDVVAAIAAVSLGCALMGLAGMELPRTGDVTVALLILTLFAVGLYSGTGAEPL